MPLNLLLVDDHAIMVDGLVLLLGDSEGLTIGATASTGAYALANLKTQHFDLMVCDFTLPDMDGATLIAKAKLIHPEIKVVMLSMHEEAPIVREVMAAGANAYVLKKHAHDELLYAIDTVSKGRQYLSEEVSRVLFSREIDPLSENQISARELEVLRLLVDEKTSKDIADELFISERTVEAHRKNLLRKTGSTNTVGLVKYAYSKKLI
jgi:two-component system, NarL family, nitrate/nitrite response regulator NarL